ncbi:hypothetical protein COY23_03195 [bacterium (Candidatus Torokbacteria) CG_4_10_14_0_2_um_filter_35_8]|nr:MAG: hypothetical protein COY23_03195 [bacterium (Candidatus Torokbacteria) CG_4_10_14_0_2_um_filter_35_8]
MKEKGFLLTQKITKEGKMEKFLIIDVPCPEDTSERFENLGLTILDAKEMTEDLLVWPGWETLKPWSTLVVFPGNGTKTVKKYIEKEKPFWFSKWPWKAAPNAKRVWILGENPQAFVGRINPGVLIGIKTVVVIDDVISSGVTIRELRKENKNFIPMAKWQAITWVMQEAAITKGFSVIFSIKTVGSKKRKVPVNSLSTLVECREIAESYARRNFGDQAEALLRLIESLC